MHNYRSNQSALMTRFRTDLRHQYGIFGSKLQTSFSRNTTRARSEEGRLFSQARQCGTKPFFPLCITYNCFNCSYIYFWQLFLKVELRHVSSSTICPRTNWLPTGATGLPTGSTSNHKCSWHRIHAR